MKKQIELMITDKLLDHFRQFIELETTDEKSEINYPKAIKLLQKTFKYTGLTTEVIDIPESADSRKNRQHLIGRRIIDQEIPTILIYSHLDVVPANYDNAFKFNIKQAKIWGRGASDMKGGIFAILSALNEVKSDDIRFNIIYWVTEDEETHQAKQLDFMTKHLKAPRNSLAFDTDTYAGGITIGRLARANVFISIKGKSTHSATSNLGRNALEDGAKLVTFLKNHIQKEYENTRSSLPSFPSSGLKHVTNRCNVNLFESGTAVNIIPDRCNLVINLRFIPELNVEDEIKKFKKRIHDYCKSEKIDYKIDDIKYIHGCYADTPYDKELNKIYTKISNEGGLYCVPASVPFAEWATKQKMPHFALGLFRGDTNIHGDNEFCYIRDFNNLVKTFSTFIKTTTKVEADHNKGHDNTRIITP